LRACSARVIASAVFVAALAMALEANTIELRRCAAERLGADTFDSYLAELEVVEVSAGRVVLRVGPTLAREAFRRCGAELAAVCRQLFGSRRVLLAGDGGWYELGASEAHGCSIPPAKTGRDARERRRVRQRSGPCGQPGIRERLAAQRAFRVPFAVAASLPRTASQAFGRHSSERPLEYVGRWGRAHSDETLTPFHLRLLLGALRLAQAGCLTEHGVACSVNLLLLAAEGKGSRELPVAREQVLPALACLLCANARYSAHHVAAHNGEPYIAEQRKLERPVLEDVLVRTAEDPERLRSLSEIIVRGEDGRWRQTAQLARGGGASILIVLGDWVIEALDARIEEAGKTFAVFDTGPFLQVGARRLFSWQQACTWPAVDPKAPLPDRVPPAPRNTVYKRIDLNHVSVRDFGRHGADLGRICEDIREDFCGEHGIARIDRRIHSVHPVWSGGVLQLWVCWRTARELPHRGELPRRLAARARWVSRRQTPRTGRQRRRQDGAHAAESSRARTAQPERRVPKIVALARSQTVSGDDGDG
jgi:hypothetical protein